MQPIYDAVREADDGVRKSLDLAFAAAQTALTSAAAAMRAAAGRRPANRRAELAEMQPAWLRACADILDQWASESPSGEAAPAPPEPLAIRERRERERAGLDERPAIDAATLPEREPGAALVDVPLPLEDSPAPMAIVLPDTSEYGDPLDIDTLDDGQLATRAILDVLSEFGDPAPAPEDEERQALEAFVAPPPFQPWQPWMGTEKTP